MDVAKLKNSCICGNTQPYLGCCGPHAVVPAPGAGLYAEFRHALHDLHLHMFPLRSLYQNFWEMLSEDSYPHHQLMADPEYAAGIITAFLWDYSVQYSDARPILRSARDIEGRELRKAHDWLEWSFAPASLFFVIEREAESGYVRQLGTGKQKRVCHGGELPAPGRCFVGRLLPFRGEDMVHTAVLELPGEDGDSGSWERAYADVCLGLGIRPSATLRPDVHCAEWRRHGLDLLALWRKAVYDEEVGRPSRNVQSVPAWTVPLPAGGRWPQRRLGLEAVPQGAGKWELRYRVLNLARLEKRDSHLQVTLLDGGFRNAVARWLSGQGMAEPEADKPPGRGWPQGQAGLDAWIHTPSQELNGQTPLQASTHDFGRRRLHDLIRDLARQGLDTSRLRKQLGL